MAVVLLQKNDEGLDHPIAFFNRTLRDAELKYDVGLLMGIPRFTVMYQQNP